MSSFERSTDADGGRWPGRPCRILRIASLAARPKWAASLFCGGLALAVGIGLVAIEEPVPRVHDEFSYLLAADTFAQGRLANPTHPMWRHFESFHVIQRPTYASKYQPGQGLLLAAGNLLGGHPVIGACLGSALAAWGVCWMLQGWVPGRWALVGGVLVAVHGMIQLRWSISYWGGGLPMTGGALVFGALPRIMRSQRIRDSLFLASGAVLLAATRPFEGLVVCLLVAAALGWWLVGPSRPGLARPAVRVVLTQILLPALLLLVVGLGWLAYYNWRVTGDPCRMPYQVHEAAYGWSPLFLWQEPKQKPRYRHAVMERLLTGWGIEDYVAQQSLPGLLAAKARSGWELWHFYLGIPLTVPLLAMPWIVASGRYRFVWMALLCFFLAAATVPWTQPHYVAPAAPLLMLLVVLGMRHFAASVRRGRRWAAVVVPAVLLLHLATLGIFYANYYNWHREGWEFSRARLLAGLRQTPYKHLVIVRYAPDHNGHAEWVYNRADIDAAQVVWAREMGMPEDQALLDYFHDRRVWLLEADAPEPQLMTYGGGNASIPHEPASFRGRNRARHHSRSARTCREAVWTGAGKHLVQNSAA